MAFDARRELATQAAATVTVDEEVFPSLEDAIQWIITSDGNPDECEVRAQATGKERLYEPAEIRALIETLKGLRP